jgi:hypothetical protein
LLEASLYCGANYLAEGANVVGETPGAAGATVTVESVEVESVTTAVESTAVESEPVVAVPLPLPQDANPITIAIAKRKVYFFILLLFFV